MCLDVAFFVFVSLVYIDSYICDMSFSSKNFSRELFEYYFYFLYPGTLSYLFTTNLLPFDLINHCLFFNLSQ
jgi:hypothetical protein